MLKEKDNQYMLIMSLIPAISVVVCCLMVYRLDKSYEMNVIYTFIAMTGIIIINVISILLLIMEQKVYEQKTRQQVMLSAYQQKEKDIESILDMHRQNSKQRHDFKNVILLIKELIRDEQYNKATEMLDKYSEGYKNNNLTEIVSDNIVLNYLLNRKINQTLGVTIVVITHEMRVIEQICQRVAVIDQSCIAEIGNVSNVITHPKSDIAKALILPKSPTENLPPCTGKRLRLVFDGSCSNEPVISRITLECHVPVNILFADTRIVEGSIYGHMVIDLPDDPQQFHDVLRWLDHNHISYLQEDGSHV